MNILKLLKPALVAALTTLVAATSFAASTCSVKSGATITPVVELYTSEGCNSCPPADRWLSTLKSQPAVVALAFHVDYWDRLGWKDRFSSADYTQRQSQQQLTDGARFSYTPQVLVDGADRPDWTRIDAVAAKSRAMSPVDVQLMRDGNRVTATIAPLASVPAHLAAYWAVTEQGHVSAVKAGENQGVTLKHDFVVREYRQVASWATSANAAATTLHFDLTGEADPSHPREVDLVVVNADNGRPVQAVKLGC